MVLAILLQVIMCLVIVLFSSMAIVLIAALLIPFRYYFSGEKREISSLEGYTTWLFGGIKFSISYFSDNKLSTKISILGIKRSVNPSSEKKENKKQGKVKKKREKPAYSYFTYTVVRLMIEKAVKIINHCRPEQFHLELSGGFDDPMYTGILYGLKGQGFAILNKYNIQLHPSFEEEELQGSFTIGGSIRIGYLILVMIEFLFAKPFRTILLKNIKHKIKFKRRLKKWQEASISMKT